MEVKKVILYNKLWKDMIYLEIKKKDLKEIEVLDLLLWQS